MNYSLLFLKIMTEVFFILDNIPKAVYTPRPKEICTLWFSEKTMFCRYYYTGLHTVGWGLAFLFGKKQNSAIAVLGSI